MRNLQLISALTGILALHPEKGVGALPLLEKALADPSFVSKASADDDKEFTADLPFLSNLHYVSEFGWATPPEAAAPGSIAVIAIQDIITRYDGWWWAGTYTKADLLARSLAHPNIEGAILFFDSPGGEASAPEVIQSVLRTAQKPVHAYVDGLCASAAYEIAASCKSITARSAYSYIGSIGTFTTVYDLKGYYERMGVKILEIYAQKSDLKNQEILEALKGNEKPLQARIDELNELFLASVRQDRGSLITDQDAYRGKLYSAPDALSAGLIDQLGSIDMVIDAVRRDAGTITSSTKKLIVC